MKTLIVLLLTLTACSRPHHADPNCGAITTTDGLNIHWIQQPILYIHNSVPPQMYSKIRKAAHAWNKALGFEAIKIADEIDNGPLDTRFDNRSVLYWMPYWTSRPAEQAVTTIRWTGSVILEADIRINTTIYHFDRFDIESILIHEMGHFLGLAHQIDPMSVMFPSLAEYEVRINIDEIDYLNVTCLYGH